MSGTAATWYIWNSDSTTTASSTDNTSTGDTWGLWCTSGASATTTNATVWIAWNGSSSQRAYVFHPAPETEEETRARILREEEARIASEQRRKQEAEALQRAEDLLMLQLAEKQKQDWRTKKAFEVLSQSGKRFRIRNAPSMNVDEYDERGKIIANHCIVSRERVPLPDQLVMQKLMLETMEADFMQIANHRAVN